MISHTLTVIGNAINRKETQMKLDVRTYRTKVLEAIKEGLLQDSVADIVEIRDGDIDRGEHYIDLSTLIPGEAPRLFDTITVRW